MSNENKLYTYKMEITFECDENNALHWHIDTPDAVELTLDNSYEEIARSGAPFSALGIRVLCDLLGNGVIELALDKASNHLWRSYFERHAEHCDVALYDAAMQGVTGDDAHPIFQQS